VVALEFPPHLFHVFDGVKFWGRFFQLELLNIRQAFLFVLLDRLLHCLGPEGVFVDTQVVLDWMHLFVLLLVLVCLFLSLLLLPGLGWLLGVTPVNITPILG
jgi:hypothetical protein